MEMRINNNVERMINANMERMIRMMTEQFSQLAPSSRELGTFPSQSEVNPKGNASSSSGNPNELVRKVNAVISLRSGREIDNQVRSPNEPCRYPHQFFEKSSSPSSLLKTGSSSKSEDATDGVPSDSDSHHLPESLSKKDELEKKDSSESVDPSPSKGHSSSSSSPSSSKKVYMPLPPFPHRLKKKDQAHIEKMRETLSQVKINIPLLDAIQQMPPYARF